MSNGLALGLLMQCISAVGYLIITIVTSIRNELFRTGLMMLFASAVAVIVTGYTVVIYLTYTKKHGSAQTKPSVYTLVPDSRRSR